MMRCRSSMDTTQRSLTKQDMVLNGISLDRLGDRVSLLRSVDQLRRDIDARMNMSAMDVFNEQAMGLLTSSRLAEALDLSKEDRKLLNAMARVTRPFSSIRTELRVYPKAC